MSFPEEASLVEDSFCGVAVCVDMVSEEDADDDTPALVEEF